MKNKILICFGFSIFLITIYFVYFYKNEKYDYSKERMKHYVFLLKNANEILYQQLEGEEQRQRTRRELSYLDYVDNTWLKINDLTQKFMNENQQDFSFDTLRSYTKKVHDIIVHHRIHEFLVKQSFSLPEIPTTELEKFSSLEKRLWYELTRMKIYECEKIFCKYFTSAFCGYTDWGIPACQRF